ncbi:hypothetical protein CWE12_02040 [Aliidiomarina sedimenti]|uniref:Peptidase M14 domain-containing protein n=1 Tax=Aliidiomarina sedimenti TaxID=1933879 RepID=A0ABY0C1Z2_9GAMM|nr:M14-type cytosolic carboxypeptidase [Aliidiomarina sedimenti]RUO31803.1 hypothetical protein CWE12_02040 [Aliidiomarina sedimenti]
MFITSQFDSGNIEVVKAEDASDIRLRIRKDAESDFFQWFHFKLYSEAERAHRLTIEGVDTAAYPDGWKDYRAMASYDREHWFRVDTSFDGKNLIIEHTPEQETVFYAYFVPYSYERHLDLLQAAQQSSWVEQRVLGQTLDGRDMTLLQIGEPAEGKKKIWVTARQHPGESMAEWFIEGLLHRLLDEDDGVARLLLDKAVFYVVPNMNPDGSVRGHLRTNAKGVNLNREWQTPSMEKSPEVYLVREEMVRIGVDMYLDIHGDEAIPYNFVAGCEGNPSYDQRLQSLEGDFKQALLNATPEFQVTHGYELDAPGQSNLTVAAANVGETFNCLSFTVEMPFKDNNDIANPETGWSDVRSQQFGYDTLAAVLAVADKLR